MLFRLYKTPSPLDEENVRKDLIVEHQATEQAPVCFHQGMKINCFFHEVQIG